MFSNLNYGEDLLFGPASLQLRAFQWAGQCLRSMYFHQHKGGRDE